MQVGDMVQVINDGYPYSGAIGRIYMSGIPTTVFVNIWDDKDCGIQAR